MHDVGIALNRHERLDLDTARRGGAPEVVPSEIDQHQMLGFLLFVAEQFIRKCHILRRSLSAFPGSRDRAQRRTPVFQFDHRFRRGPYESQLVRLQEKGVGRGIDEPQRTVKLKRRRTCRSGKFL